MSFYTLEEQSILIFVKASPSSSKNEIIGVEEDTLKIKLKAPPVDGEANKELINFLAKQLKLPKSQIEILKGASSKRKRLRVAKTTEIEQFLQGFSDETKN